jgi:hypothetical protein
VSQPAGGLDRKAQRIAQNAIESRPTADFALELKIAYAILSNLGIKE